MVDPITFMLSDNRNELVWDWIVHKIWYRRERSDNDDSEIWLFKNIPPDDYTLLKIPNGEIGGVAVSAFKENGYLRLDYDMKLCFKHKEDAILYKLSC